jgi:S1-C subfamily serine protease
VQQIPSGTGSGFVWDREGHIVTNCHVIQDAVTRLVPQVITRGRAIQAGIGASFIPQRFNAAIGIKDGVALADVHADGPAARAGLTGAQLTRSRRVVLGDRIVAVDGKPVRSEDDLRDVFEVAGVGATVTLTVAHQSTRRDVRIVLGQE